VLLILSDTTLVVMVELRKDEESEKEKSGRLDMAGCERKPR
jgi:hypothetical protein